MIEVKGLVFFAIVLILAFCMPGCVEKSANTVAVPIAPAMVKVIPVHNNTRMAVVGASEDVGVKAFLADLGFTNISVGPVANTTNALARNYPLINWG